MSGTGGRGRNGGRVLVSASTAARAVPYVEALRAVGVAAESIRVLAAGDAEGAGAGAGARAGTAGVAELAGGAAGLLLCGGSDVEPRRYGEEPLPGAGVEEVPARDALEWELLGAARARRLPVWGICRGFQVLNVFFGGSLWQDLPLQRPADVVHDPEAAPDALTHPLAVLAPAAPLGERLAAAGPAPRVNSRHHQGVKRLGAGLLAVAAAPDDLIEAFVLADGAAWGGDGGAGGRSVIAAASDVTGTGGASASGRPEWWVRGVEWHPENLLALPEQLALWRDFAAAVLGRRAAGVE
jgi:putative glutamine amidotransferase